MRILHTSDWHLGKTLYSKKERHEEQLAFLDWLQSTAKSRSINALIVAGDIFDTVSPSSASQKMYYDFLLKIRDFGCENVIIVGGNHDSPSFLGAPKEILAALDVHVIGSAGENLEDEIIVICDKKKNPALIVCAVPFLRERDISRFAEGEAYSDRSKRILESIKLHYEKIAALAERKRDEIGADIPIIATGHMSVAGKNAAKGDGVRDIYIGNIEAVGSDIFPKIFDYVALGHYHVSSEIEENIRYSGSPIPMGFGEAEQKKCVFIVDFGEGEAKIETLEIPVFQRLESICGDKAYIEARIDELKKADTSVWVEIIYDGNEIFSDLKPWAEEKTADSKIEILNHIDRQYVAAVLASEEEAKPLEEFDKFEVFDKLLEKNNIPSEQKEDLKNLYREIAMEL
ncbi:MAG: exonuclease subunit SbcD [Oscillospiraceae bacterium]|nr:exonuclease subunit SbcD [Oscillospiraceae bacterium]